MKPTQIDELADIAARYQQIAPTELVIKAKLSGNPAIPASHSGIFNIFRIRASEPLDEKATQLRRRVDQPQVIFNCDVQRSILYKLSVGDNTLRSSLFRKLQAARQELPAFRLGQVEAPACSTGEDP